MKTVIWNFEGVNFRQIQMKKVGGSYPERIRLGCRKDDDWLERWRWINAGEFILADHTDNFIIEVDSFCSYLIWFPAIDIVNIFNCGSVDNYSTKDFNGETFQYVKIFDAVDNHVARKKWMLEG